MSLYSIEEQQMISEIKRLRNIIREQTDRFQTNIPMICNNINCLSENIGKQHYINPNTGKILNKDCGFYMCFDCYNKKGAIPKYEPIKQKT